MKAKNPELLVCSVAKKPKCSIFFKRSMLYSYYILNDWEQSSEI